MNLVFRESGVEVAKKEKYYIEYKYEGYPWIVYDWTIVKGWKNTQYQRMLGEHPKAEHRIRVVK